MRVLDELHPIAIAWRGGLWRGSISTFEDRCPHVFGRPLDLSVRGLPKNPRSLHRLLTLDLRDSRLNISLPNTTVLPLLYGFAYDGCVLDYQIVSDAEVRIMELTPRLPSREWPYKDYPNHFAARPVALGARKRISRTMVTRLTWQGLDDEAADQLVVIVRPSDSFGVSLWGECGDDEEVEVIFCIAPETGRVSASNQCT
jgi:hypothetical protein